jgi:hypothetical protein
MNLLAILFLKVLISKKISLIFTLEIQHPHCSTTYFIGGGGDVEGVWGSCCRRALTTMQLSRQQGTRSLFRESLCKAGIF